MSKTERNTPRAPAPQPPTREDARKLLAVARAVHEAWRGIVTEALEHDARRLADLEAWAAGGPTPPAAAAFVRAAANGHRDTGKPCSCGECAAGCTWDPFVDTIDAILFHLAYWSCGVWFEGEPVPLAKAAGWPWLACEGPSIHEGAAEQLVDVAQLAAAELGIEVPPEPEAAP